MNISYTDDMGSHFNYYQQDIHFDNRKIIKMTVTDKRREKNGRISFRNCQIGDFRMHSCSADLYFNNCEVKESSIQHVTIGDFEIQNSSFNELKLYAAYLVNKCKIANSKFGKLVMAHTVLPLPTFEKSLVEHVEAFDCVIGNEEYRKVTGENLSDPNNLNPKRKYASYPKTYMGEIEVNKGVRYEVIEDAKVISISPNVFITRRPSVLFHVGVAELTLPQVLNKYKHLVKLYTGYPASKWVEWFNQD